MYKEILQFGGDMVLTDEKNTDQKSMYWRNESLSSTSASSESGSSVSSRSNSSIISDDVTAYRPQAPVVSGSIFTTIYLNHHKKLNRSQSDSKARYNRNGGNNASSKYKTELCNTFMENNGECKYKDKCQFAHGLHELRVVDRHPKYKTVLCRTYHVSDWCPYGQRCHFIHESPNQKKMTPDTASPLAMSPVNDLMLSLRDLSMSPSSMGSLSPASSMNAFSFDSSASSTFQSPPPSPIERRLPIFSEISGPSPMLPFSTHFGGLTA